LTGIVFAIVLVETCDSNDRKREYNATVFFAWDTKKAKANIQKHGVDFREASTVFDDPLSTTFPDMDHSTSEKRCLIIGMSARFRLLVVSHTERKNNIRIISARPATRREQKYYEEEK
jgi:uncharacterized protein